MKTTIRLITTSLFGLAMMATAQNRQKPPADPPAPSTREVPAAANGREITADTLSAEAAIQPQFSLGWNTIHPKYCEVYKGYLYVYYSGGYFYTNNSVFQGLIYPACQTGNYLKFYVYDSSGHWNDVYAYPYK
jgi:hypothetical protein